MASLSTTASTAAAGNSLASFAGLHRQTHLLSGHPAANADPNSQLFRRRPGLFVRTSRWSPRLNGRKLRVAVVGGGPAGGAAAEALAKGGMEKILIERKLDNYKPCSGAIPLCMVDEFGLPLDLINRQVTKMKMISPSNVAIDIGRTLTPNEYIGMVRREVLDAYLWGRAADAGASVINGLFLQAEPGQVVRREAGEATALQQLSMALEVADEGRLLDAVVAALIVAVRRGICRRRNFN